MGEVLLARVPSPRLRAGMEARLRQCFCFGVVHTLRATSLPKRGLRRKNVTMQGVCRRSSVWVGFPHRMQGFMGQLYQVKFR